MSRLYVRVFTGFYHHRKTRQLRRELGNDAFWIPPRLWAYAAEHEPDGSFDGFTPDDIADAIGYEGDASSMLQALVTVGFMDEEPLRIHNWDRHNQYHKTFSERAKKAAEARWNKPPSPTPPTPGKGQGQGKGKRSKHASSINACSSDANDTPPDAALSSLSDWQLTKDLKETRSLYFEEKEAPRPDKDMLSAWAIRIRQLKDEVKRRNLPTSPKQHEGERINKREAEGQKDKAAIKKFSDLAAIVDQVANNDDDGLSDEEIARRAMEQKRKEIEAACDEVDGSKPKPKHNRGNRNAGTCNEGKAHEYANAAIKI